MEEWKDVDGYDGEYEISNLGRVRSNKGLHSRILKQRTMYLGYKCSLLSKEGRRKSFLTHRLVAIHFIGDFKNERKEVNHKDGDKTNNTLENLEWVTHAENMKHSKENGLAKGGVGERNNKAKLTEMQVLAIDTLLKSDFTPQFIAPNFGVLPTNIYDIKNGKIWAWLTGRERTKTSRMLKEEREKASTL